MAMMQLKELDVWKSAIELSYVIYELTQKFPETEQMTLTHQMRNTVVVIPSKIASAASRKYGKESLSHLFIAKDRIFELETQLHIAHKLVYITDDELNETLEKLDTSRRLIFGFIKHYSRTY